MSTISTSVSELGEGKPSLTTVMPPPDQSDTQEEAAIEKPLQKVPDDQLKTPTPATSEEDASGGRSANHTEKHGVGEDVDSKPTTTKEGGGIVERGSETEVLTAGAEDVKVELSPLDKVKGRKGKNISSREQFSEDDSQDSSEINDDILEEDDLAYTAEGQELYQQRAPKRIKQFGQCFWNVEYRMTFLEDDLKKLRGIGSKTEPKNDAKDVTKDESAKPQDPQKAILSIRRLTWADFKPSVNPKEASEVRVSKTTPPFMRGLKFHPNLGKEGEPDFAIASGDQPDATSGILTKRQHHVLEVLIEDPGINKRRRVRKQTDDEIVTKGASRNAKLLRESDATTAQTSKPTLQCPERLRICSTSLASFLGNLVDPDFQYSPSSHVVFLRPFKILVLYETEIRNALKELEKKW